MLVGEISLIIAMKSDLYDHPEEIDIFCMGDVAQLAWAYEYRSSNKPMFPTWIHPTDKTVTTQLFRASSYKDNNYTRYPLEPITNF